MLNLKFKRVISPFIDSEINQNCFKRFINKENNSKKNFSYTETTKITGSYYDIDNEKTQLSSVDYSEYLSGNTKKINIKHSNKSKNFRQGVEINQFLIGHNGFQAKGPDLYDEEIGQLENYDDNQFNDYNVKKIPFNIINKSGLIEPLSIRDSLSLQENVPLLIHNFIKGTLHSGDESVLTNYSESFIDKENICEKQLFNNFSNSIDIKYKNFMPYDDSFDQYINIGNEKILLNNNVLNEKPIEKYSILGNDDYYFDNIGTFAFSGLKYSLLHKHQSIEINVDHQTEYWGEGLLFNTPLNSVVNITTTVAGSGRAVNITGNLTGHAQITTNTNGSGYPSGRFSFSIDYGVAPGYINPEIKYAGYFINTTLYQNISGKYEVPDGTKYYNIPVIFTSHNDGIDPNTVGHGLTIDIIIRKSFISEVKINNYGKNYPVGEFRYGIPLNALYPGSESSTGIGIIKIK